MGALGTQVLITTGRSQRTAAGKSPPSIPYLIEEPAHIKRVPQREANLLPESALESEYEARAESGADIRTGDRILAIVLAADGVTPWPDAGVWADPDRATASQGQNWIVAWAAESAPGPRPFRQVYLKRQDTRGGMSG